MLKNDSLVYKKQQYEKIYIMEIILILRKDLYEVFFALKNTDYVVEVCLNKLLLLVFMPLLIRLKKDVRPIMNFAELLYYSVL